MTAWLLPIPDDPRFQEIIDAWPEGFRLFDWPRSAWLSLFEQHLQFAYPHSNSASRKLTARHYAPFPLARGPNVP